MASSSEEVPRDGGDVNGHNHKPLQCMSEYKVKKWFHVKKDKE